MSELSAAMMPSPTGDRFFDEMPADIDGLRNGEIIGVPRDITATAAALVGAPSRVYQFKFRSEDSSGAPTFGTASLVVPTAPWRGPRPVVVNNLPIDSLGTKCTPGYTMSHGVGLETGVTDYIPPMTALAAARGYAVLIPDHEGPRMAYAEPTLAGHIVLDAIRAVRELRPADLGRSRYAMTGYSGGAIATNGAAKLLDSYAPDLKQAVVGAAIGGTPIDQKVLSGSMTGPLNWAKGVFIGAGYGIAREQPEILTKLNNLSRQVAPHLRDLCIIPVALLGQLPFGIDVLSTMRDPLNSSFARAVYDRNSLKGMRYGTPLYVYNGAQEFWIPSQMATALFREQCRLGVPSMLRLVPGEHVIAALVGLPDAFAWLDQRLRGRPAPDGC